MKDLQDLCTTHQTRTPICVPGLGIFLSSFVLEMGGGTLAKTVQSGCAPTSTQLGLGRK